MDQALQKDPTILCQLKTLRPLTEDMKGELVALKISIALRGQQTLALHQLSNS